jgi:site-specific DNA-methyltransferase (adenine-specific)
VWGNPDLKWLDPACKTGVFLREAAKRLMVGLKDAIPDEVERRERIFKNMLHGFAITELTALVSRRTLYYSKDAHGDHAIIHFDNPDGNILYERREHTWKGKDGSRRCEQCGAPESIEYKNHTWADREKPRHCELCGGREDVSEKPEKCKGMENHAYRFIHLDEKEKQMKFDVIIGNPPYQINDGGGGKGSSAFPIYHRFVNMAKSLNPRYVTFVIPARWFAGGKGLTDFREEMIADRRLSKIVDYPNASECFPGVEIKGGVMYFLWDRDHDGDCEWVNVRSGQFSEPALRDLRDAGDTIVREEIAFGILDKVQTIHTGDWMDDEVSSSKPFGLRSFVRGKPTQSSADIKLYQNGGIGYVARKEILKNSGWVDKWKALVSKAYGGKDEFPHRITGRPFVAEKSSACTETYLVAGLFDSKAAAERRVAYMKTRFFRFMVSLRKISQNSSQGTYAFVPVMDAKQDWTDEELYKHFKLTKEEIAHIEATVKEMP